MREPIVVREVVIEHKHVGAQTVELVRELVGGRGHGCDGEIRLGFDESAQTGEHGRVII